MRMITVHHRVPFLPPLSGEVCWDGMEDGKCQLHYIMCRLFFFFFFFLHKNYIHVLASAMRHLASLREKPARETDVHVRKTVTQKIQEDSLKVTKNMEEFPIESFIIKRRT